MSVEFKSHVSSPEKKYLKDVEVLLRRVEETKRKILSTPSRSAGVISLPPEEASSPSSRSEELSRTPQVHQSSRSSSRRVSMSVSWNIDDLINNSNDQIFQASKRFHGSTDILHGRNARISPSFGYKTKPSPLQMRNGDVYQEWFPQTNTRNMDELRVETHPTSSSYRYSMNISSISDLFGSERKQDHDMEEDNSSKFAEHLENVTFGDIVRDITETTERIKALSPQRGTLPESAKSSSISTPSQSRFASFSFAEQPFSANSPFSSHTKASSREFSDDDLMIDKRLEIQELLRQLAYDSADDGFSLDHSGLDLRERVSPRPRITTENNNMTQHTSLSNNHDHGLHEIDSARHYFSSDPNISHTFSNRSLSSPHYRKGSRVVHTKIPYSHVRHLQNLNRSSNTGGYNHSTIEWYLNLCSSKYDRHSSMKDLNKSDRVKVRWVGFEASHESRPQSSMSPPRSLPPYHTSSLNVNSEQNNEMMFHK